MDIVFIVTIVALLLATLWLARAVSRLGGDQ